MSPRAIATAVAAHLTRFGDVHPLPPMLLRLVPDRRVAVGRHRPLLSTTRIAGIVLLPPSAIRRMDADSPRGVVIARCLTSELPYDVVEFDPIVIAEWLQSDPRNRQDVTSE